MHIVHPDEDLACAAETSECVQKSDSHRVSVWRRTLQLLEDERARECPTLCGWKRRQRFLENGIEKVTEPGKAQRGLALGRLRSQHADACALCRFDSGSPERRLPHPGLPLED